MPVQNGTGVDAGGGSQTAGGNVGAHPGCGTERRFAGGWMQGSEDGGSGGAGGAGLWGGGGGEGGSTCMAGIQTSGSSGGGGGSSYVSPDAALAVSDFDTTVTPGITIEPVKF